ncbi:restriction endonuclease subunit S [Thermoflavifilum thermophilum]|uniref:Type I restriction enzyme, S subunit n=1 Tax=Thermoflavifilum thermophilum TaxID=1393122 RepID=A0A1I7NFA7_9BACT|nr:restriction endonuclease subunit S [Thermoflavifilum thermophilum]SFV33338.1 type I restriction enzyme, S subunit [Thermoflavifilum thermophilum]
MSNKKKNSTSTKPGARLVPKLRFPEFKDSGEWEMKTIDEICEVLNNLRKPLSSNLREKGVYPYYGASGVIDYVKDFIFNERLLLIGEDGAKWEAYEKTAFIAEGKYWVNNHAHVLKPIGIVDTLLENYLIKLDISPFITGAAPPKLTLGKLKSIPVPIPQNHQEQQKIAAFLSSLDELITAESQKLEVLKEHKKGLLQNLFPQEGETVPKLRFPEFKGNWQIVRLGCLTEIKGRIGYRGYTTNDIVEKDQGAITLSPSNIDDNNQLKFDKVTYISWEKYYESPEIMLQEGYTVLVKTGSSFGKAAFIKNLPEKSTINPQLVVLKPKKILDKFLFLLICNSTIQKQINETVVGGAIPTLSQESISNFVILVPPNVDKYKKEQQKIAACLSSLDDLITAQTQKIELLKQQKKGLLQGLFPNLNEVTV